jgi:hypothetical protein
MPVQPEFNILCFTDELLELIEALNRSRSAAKPRSLTKKNPEQKSTRKPKRKGNQRISCKAGASVELK